MQRRSNQKEIKENSIPVLGSSSSAAIVMASPSHPPKYDVFLSFRGLDTRNNFTSHLHNILCRKNIETFIDYKIDRGNEISDELYTAIEESTIYVIILSENYASSSWCLKELVKILDCKKKYGRHVIPVFYHVEPSTVKYQTGSYEKAFTDQKEWFDDEVIQSWKDALTKIAGLSGTAVNNTRPETVILDGIVEDLLEKLNSSFSSTDDQGMVGIEERIAEIKSLLQLESEAVRIIGIWGMGGMGKTTLARALHNKLAAQFSSRSCVVNAHKEIERIGIDSLRTQILSELLDNETIPSNRLQFAIKRVKRKRVLLILDDVKDSSQIQELIGGRENFGPGSKIIVTSRNMQVIKNVDADETCEVKEMNSKDSLKLFSLKAFKPNSHKEVNVDLVEKVLKYAQGVPLALQVLGNLLCGRAKKEWKSQLQKLKKSPEDNIFNVLKLSYDELEDYQKVIFLDIVFIFDGVFAGFYVDKVVEWLNDCGFPAQIGIDILKDRGLISILRDQIVVHDRMVEMGKEIVHRQCVNDPGKRSHLQDHANIYDVLRKKKGTDAIQCIALDLYKIKEVQLHPETFKSMHNLRILFFHGLSFFKKYPSNVILPEFIQSLPDGLKVLSWSYFPLQSLPLHFCPENLVRFEMVSSNLEQLWEDDEELPNLKTLDLSYSRNLVRIPDLSNFPNIEEIILVSCKSLVQVYSSSFLSKLKFLWLNGCVKLRSFNLPSNILLRSVGLVGLNGCENLKTFSITWSGAEVVESHGRSHFDGLSRAGTSGYQEMNGRALKDIYDLRVEASFRPSHYSELCLLDLGDHRSLTCLPIDLHTLKFLRRLYLDGCSNLKKFPEIEETMENLAVLVLDETAIQELPSSLHRLVGLQELSLRKCRSLKIIPSSIGRLTKLCKLDLTCCESLETFPSSIFKLNLTKLDLNGCSKLKTFPEILEPVESFTHISLERATIKVLPSSLDRLVGLQTLSLYSCHNLESLPSSICNLNLLSELDCSFCSKLTEIPNDIGCLSSLKKLSLQFTRIVNLPESIAHLSSLESLVLSQTHIASLPQSIAHLSSLKSLDVSYCRKLECIPNDIGCLSSLKKLALISTGIMNFPESMAHLSSLESLNLSGTGIANLPDIIADLSRLKLLDVSECKNLVCISQLPPFLEKLLASGCPSIKRVMPNSKLKRPSNSKEGTFEFHFTNREEPDPSGLCDVVADARLRIREDAYRFVYYCFPGSAVPDWFPYRGEGNSVTMDKGSLNDGLIGFAMCVVLQEDMDCTSISYRITFVSDAGTHILPHNYQLKDSFNLSFSRLWRVRQEHTFLWTHYLMDSPIIARGNFHAYNFTFDFEGNNSWLVSKLYLEVKECGIWPLYTKEKDNGGGVDDNSRSVRVSNNLFEEHSGKRQCLR